MAQDEASDTNQTTEVNIATEAVQTSEEERKKDSLLRRKRDLILKTTELGRDLSSDDEEKENLGIEEVSLILLSFNRMYLTKLYIQRKIRNILNHKWFERLLTY